MSQTEQILEHLKAGSSITPLGALNLFGSFRLGSRIWDIKHMGYQIETTLRHENGKQFAEYRLKKEVK